MVKHQGGIVSAAQVVTTTAVSTDSLDIGIKDASGNVTVGRDLGQGGDIVANFVPLTSVTAAGAATVTFEIITADDAALTSNVTVLASSRPYAKEELAVVTTVGNSSTLPITVTIPANLSARPAAGPVSGAGANQYKPRMRRYLGVRYTIATGPLNTGSFNAWFGPNHVGDANKWYPAGW